MNCSIQGQQVKKKLEEIYENQNIVKVFEHEKDKVVYKKSRKTSEDFTDIFIRDSIIHAVVEKIQKMKEESLSKIVFTQKPFGLRTNFIEFNI